MSRIKKIKEQHPNLDISIIDIIASLDPTSTYKYLPFMIKTFKNELEEDETVNLHKRLGKILFNTEFVNLIEKFENHCKANRIEKNDITKYNNISELIVEIKKADEIKKQKETEKQVIKLFDNEEYLVLFPLTYEATKMYGANTKWCITQKQHWQTYKWKYKIFFLIHKKENKKFAISVNYKDPNKDGSFKVDAWLADDTSIDVTNLPVSDELMLQIIKEIRKPMFDTELKHLKLNEIYNENGEVINIFESTTDDLKFFIKLFGSKIDLDKAQILSEKSNGYDINKNIKISSRVDEIAEKIRLKKY